jgi:hypothetical protein
VAILQLLLGFLKTLLAGRAGLVAENLALRWQLLVLQRSIKRPRLGKSDRVIFARPSLWALFSRATQRSSDPARPGWSFRGGQEHELKVKRLPWSQSSEHLCC